MNVSSKRDISLVQSSWVQKESARLVIREGSGESVEKEGGRVETEEGDCPGGKGGLSGGNGGIVQVERVGVRWKGGGGCRLSRWKGGIVQVKGGGDLGGKGGGVIQVEKGGLSRWKG